ncbi:DUF6468 domain-containing protein [Asticcacaulis benevestitus]|uniref:DUF6468 domain-containing protein n=1 Tax=Asticcacaulis benevestitus DSM 16100 = ATCC BAA-896 TaxID=1121022 RepID=V4Q0U3_9CAUL|nr:DUF6468 domain-containing protein [Asticcacaulis benevestitus]ESQ91445.1 hypothetical protein ABENE_10555 [Asticcacaulis benevestitus DSM 16100 = ATCC BAA-896]
MSMANIIMNVILMALLVAALWFGMRLDKRLKALRAAHEGFAKAVHELDDAAIRAHNSLKELRSNADESQDLLHGRILAARDVLQKLDLQVARAERVQGELDKGMVSFEAARSLSMMRPEPVRPELVREAPRPEPAPEIIRSIHEEPAAPRARDRTAFTNDIVRPGQTPYARKDLSRGRPSLLPEITPEDESEMVDAVQMSELVVANLNEMIRSLNLPVRQAVSVEDELFGGADVPSLRKR